MLQILVIEDDIILSSLLKLFLEKEGYHVLVAADGKEAFDIFDQKHIDLVITDIMLPFLNGNTIAKNLRYSYPTLPIITITALDSYRDKKESFNSGVDDYIVKPIEFNELSLRIKALLRRYKAVSSNEITHKNIHLDYLNKSLTIGKVNITLTNKEFELLYLLTASPKRIYTRKQLMDEIWGYDNVSYERTVDTHIKRLRDKVSSSDIEIITVRGLGYKVILK